MYNVFRNKSAAAQSHFLYSSRKITTQLIVQCSLMKKEETTLQQTTLQDQDSSPMSDHLILEHVGSATIDQQCQQEHKRPFHSHHVSDRTEHGKHNSRNIFKQHGMMRAYYCEFLLQPDLFV